MDSDEHDVAAVRAELLGLKHMRERMAAWPHGRGS
jgi:hypothetical protein